MQTFCIGIKEATSLQMCSGSTGVLLDQSAPFVFAIMSDPPLLRLAIEVAWWNGFFRVYSSQ